MSKKIAEIAYDLHSGLAAARVTEFDDLQTVGMAATLAIHIKGLGEIDYEVLRKVSDHFMSIPSFALEKPLRALAEIGFVRLIEKGRKIEKIIPNIPTFDDVYTRIGGYTKSELQLNEHEQATVEILSKLQDAPYNRDVLFTTTGLDRTVFDRCVKISGESGIISEHAARGKKILISPFYFADNLDTLADAAAASGANSISSVLKKVKENQGWPLSMAVAQSEIGGSKLDATEADILRKLATEGVIKPPTIKFGLRTESFLFTPKPGKTRLNAANREMYERAMALVSAVRKGQLLPNAYRILAPARILEVLRDRGYIGSNSEAREQYQNLVLLRVATLQPTSSSRWQLHLIETEENRAALNLAIQLLRTGALANLEVNDEARIALMKNEEYIQSLISATELKKRERQIQDSQAKHEFEQLLLRF